MQFSVIALSLASASVALAADAISQIDDGQIQATSAPVETETTAPVETETTAPVETETTAPVETETTAPVETETTEAPATESSTLEITTQTENGANQLAGGAALAGLFAAGALLI